MPTPRFQNKTALVTGGNSGIGLAAALAFAAEGARLVITGRDEKTLASAKAALGPSALALPLDASSVSAAQTLADTLASQSIKLDAIFLNAGVAKLAPMEQTDEALWDSVFAINAKGPYFTIKSLLPLINENAAIVLNGSINAHIGMPGTTVYAASKAALISLAKTISAELLPKKIRVNVISPGPIQTPLYGRLGVPVDKLGAVADSIKSQVPLGRFGTPEEVASAVLYLASTDAAFILGTELFIDGGMSQL